MIHPESGLVHRSREDLAVVTALLRVQDRACIMASDARDHPFISDKSEHFFSTGNNPLDRVEQVVHGVSM